MQCTAEEIERKRKLALEKLNNKKKNKTTNSNQENQQPFRFRSPNPNGLGNFNCALKSPSIASKISLGPYDKPVPVQSFYGKNDVVTASCTLISENHFHMEVSRYSQPVIDIFKTINSKAFDMKTKLWNFHLNDYDLLMQKLAVLHPNVRVFKLPSYVVQCCKTPQPDYSRIDLDNIDKELLNLLMPFQVDGICFGIDKQGRCLIADEMGLGKTFQALAIANYYISDWPLLIATTSSMKRILCLALTTENWKYSFIKYSNVLKFINKNQSVVGSKKMSQLSHHDKAVLNCIFNPNLPVDEAYNEELGDNVKDVDVNTPNVIQSKQLECQGIKLAEKKCFQEALKFLKEAIEVTPQRASPYNNRAQIYQLKGDVENAFSDLNKAIKLASKNEEKRTLCQAYCQRGLLYRKNEEMELAKNDFGQAALLGSSFAKNQLVQLNPYSALCNQMLSHAFDALK